MSVFRVKLNNTQQGLLDLDPRTDTNESIGGAGAHLGTQMQPSVQRSMYVTGPNLIYRELIDGSTFTDCNYWKQFAYPQCPLSEAIVEVVTDDGSIWSSDPDANTFPYFTNVSVTSSSTYLNNYIDILGTWGSGAIYTSLFNQGVTGSTQDIQVKINGSSTAVFTLAHNTTQVFDSLAITSIAFQGGSATTTVQVILSIKSVCYS